MAHLTLLLFTFLSFVFSVSAEHRQARHHGGRFTQSSNGTDVPSDTPVLRTHSRGLVTRTRTRTVFVFPTPPSAISATDSGSSTSSDLSTSTTPTTTTTPLITTSVHHSTITSFVTVAPTATPKVTTPQQYLDIHNAARSMYGSGALEWSADLAEAAQDWADQCLFTDGSNKGENIAAGTGAFSGEAAVSLWIDEAAQYDASNPAASHFTQVVWNGTQEVGCAVATCTGIFPPIYGVASYYVCRYSPPGNVIGQFQNNIHIS